MDLYLDYNGSTPVHPEVAAAVLASFTETSYGNASAGHPLGCGARAAIDRAKATIAAGIGAKPEEIGCTSGGTESNNWALRGVLLARDGGAGKRHLITTPIEHWSVRRTAEWMEGAGIDVTYLPVGESGAVTVESVEAAFREETRLVSVMVANNETGTLQPVREIAELCRERGVLFHCDAVSALGKIPIDVNEIGCDLLSLSSHKMYAPKGTGVLYIREGVELEPLIFGCGQQDGRRSGTENTTGVLAFARAFELLADGTIPDPGKLARLRDRLEAGILDVIPGALRNGTGPCLPNTLSMAFPGHRGSDLQAGLAEHGICVAAGAAATGAKPSHVLTAMGLSEERTRSTLRFSLGSGTTEETIDTVVEALAQLVGSEEGKDKPDGGARGRVTLEAPASVEVQE